MKTTPFTSAALFDLDHTLFNCNSSFSFGRYLYKHKVISFLTLAHLAVIYYLCKWGIVSLQTMHQSAFEAFFKGKKFSDISCYIEPWLDQNWDAMVRPALHQELQSLRGPNTYTAILSNSPDFIVGPISKRFSMNDFYATHYFLDQKGHFAEIKKWVEGKDKADYLNSISRDLGIPKDKIRAYTDSALDLPFLETAGIPICVSPEPKLKAIAQKRNWAVIA